jgi:kynurenine 3-monooxygenase
MKTITIVGAGLSGSLLSLYLAQQNYAVNVYEKRPDMRLSKIERGRSINLAISKRGVYALERLGIAEKVMKKAVPMYARMIHDTEKNCVRQAYGRSNNEHIDAISRSDLNIDLLNSMDAIKNINVFFNHHVKSIDVDSGKLDVLDSTKNKVKSLFSETIIATDGGPSAIRQEMMKKGIVKYDTDFLSHGYKELTVESNIGKKLDKNCLHIWPRDNFMLIALPNAEGSFTCTLFLPIKEGKENFSLLQKSDKILSFFNKYFPDVVEIVPDLTSQFIKNPIGELVTLKGKPWYYKNKVLLLGDAAHAIVPFFGQGMNCAFEDCTVFDDLLKSDIHHDWENIFKKFYLLRKENSDAIAQMAVDNFYEMSKYTGEEEFILHKKVEKKLMEQYGDKYISRYVLVSFTIKSYKLAQECGKLQMQFLRNICRNIKSENDLCWNIVEKKFKEYTTSVENLERKYKLLYQLQQ